MIRVLIVADSAVLRSGLEESLHGDHRFVVDGSGSSSDATALLSRGRNVDVILAEAPQGDARSFPALPDGHPPVVLLADDLSGMDIRTALHDGAKALLSSDASAQEIAAAIEAAAAGLTALGPEIAETAFPTAPPDSLGSYGEKLTAREAEVLALLAEGAGNKEIAARLALSEHTVKFHVSSILGKLGVSSRTEAVTEAIRRGLVFV